MPKLLLGSLAAGLAMWLVGFIFWGPLLGWIPFTAVSDVNSAALQQALQTHLGPTGTGAYAIPSPSTTGGSELYARGPVAIVQFNAAGYPIMDSGALIWGLVLAVVCALLLGLALRSVAAHLGFGDRLKLVALVAVAITGYAHIGQPVFNHAPWGYFIYLFVSDLVTWLVAGAVLSRWFLPEPTVRVFR